MSGVAIFFVPVLTTNASPSGDSSSMSRGCLASTETLRFLRVHLQNYVSRHIKCLYICKLALQAVRAQKFALPTRIARIVTLGTGNGGCGR